MTPKRLLALAAVLLVAAVVSAVAPKHPVYNPAWASWVLCGVALCAAWFAREEARWRKENARSAEDVDFVVAFDDRVITLTNPDGSTESARWDELESISVRPDDDPFLIWTGPFLVVLQVQGGRCLHVPAFTVGLDAFLERLRQLPRVDSDGLESPFREPRIVWTRERKD